MQKDFWKWHRVKERIQQKGAITFFHEGEVWWCSIGCNVGHEEDGKHGDFSRPILILKNFNKQLCWVLPFTSKPHKGFLYYSPQAQAKDLFGSLILSQLRVIDTKRLIRKMGKISKYDFEIVKELIITLIK